MRLTLFRQRRLGPLRRIAATLARLNKKKSRVYATELSVFLITHLLRFSVRHPRVVVTLAGVVTVCALVFIPRIQLRLDGRSLIPAGLPQFAEGDQAASRFELRDLVLIGVGNEESGIYTPETLQRIA